MRDPNRLYSFYGKLRDVHIRSFSDLRFGQFMSNFFGWMMAEKQRDLFFPEEDEMIKLLYEFEGKMNGI